jgi:menaquinone-specific isochorismate synthase
MPDRLSALSLAEARLRPVVEGWVDRSLSEGLSAAKARRRPLLYTNSRELPSRLPLAVFDSSVRDVFLFAGRARSVLGAGVAATFDPRASRRAASRSKRGLSKKEVTSAQDAPGVTVVGGWGFPAASKVKRAAIWRDFPTSRWVVPALTLTSEEGASRLTLAVHLSPSSELLPVRRAYLALVGALGLDDDHDPQGGAIPGLESARSVPSRRTWVSRAKRATDSISSGELKKVVLARALSLTFRDKIPTSTIIRRLTSLNPDSTVFAVKMNDSVFMGATPESLVSVKDRDVEVDCLAATLPRSKDLEADETLGTRLLGDSKSRREHGFVVNAAVRALSSISSVVDVPEAPVVKKLTTVQHLYTAVRAKLLDGKDAWDAALSLWPNPAIGGEPKDRAIRWIHSSEGFDRGWYSGAIGLLSAQLDEADLVVGIRSGIIKGRRALVYAGAGLVAGSVPEEEFEETSWKLGTMGRALGVDESALADGGR